MFLINPITNLVIVQKSEFEVTNYLDLVGLSNEIEHEPSEDSIKLAIAVKSESKDTK